MSHPDPKHDPENEVGRRSPDQKLNKNQKMTSRWFKEAGKTFPKKGESPVAHIKRLTGSKSKALNKAKKGLQNPYHE